MPDARKLAPFTPTLCSMINMKKLVLFVGMIILGQVSIYVTFFAFYESWFPYYWSKYLPYTLPLMGLVTLIIPFPLARFRPTEKSLRVGYYLSFIFFNLLVLVSCVAVFVYMLSTGFCINESGVYKIVPVGV